MKKIKTVFTIDRETNKATEKVNPSAQWVLDGEGVATLKVDGSACMVKDGILYKRYDRKLQSRYMKEMRAKTAKGQEFIVTEDMFNVLPDNAIACQEKPDPVTYHHPHWVAIDKNKPEDVFHIEALEKIQNPLEDGTYELIGEKVNSNPYKMSGHKLVKHGVELLNVPDRSFGGIKAFLDQLDGEGIVFHRANGEMAKIRRKDMCNMEVKLDMSDDQIKYTAPPDVRNKPKNKM